MERQICKGNAPRVPHHNILGHSKPAGREVFTEEMMNRVRLEPDLRMEAERLLAGGPADLLDHLDDGVHGGLRLVLMDAVPALLREQVLAVRG